MGEDDISGEVAAQGVLEYSPMEPRPDSLERPGAFGLGPVRRAAELCHPAPRERLRMEQREIPGSAEARGHNELLETLVLPPSLMCHNHTSVDFGSCGLLANRRKLATRPARHIGPRQIEDHVRLVGPPLTQPQQPSSWS